MIINEAAFLDRIKKSFGDLGTELKNRAMYAAGDEVALGRLNRSFIEKQVRKDWDHYKGLRLKGDAEPDLDLLLSFLQYDYGITLNPNDLKSFEGNNFDEDEVLEVVTDSLIANGNLFVGRKGEVHKATKSSSNNRGQPKAGSPIDDDDEEEEVSELELSKYSIFPNKNIFINISDFQEALRNNNARKSSRQELAQFLSEYSQVSDIPNNSEVRGKMSALLISFLESTSDNEDIIDDAKDAKFVERYQKFRDMFQSVDFKPEYYSQLKQHADDVNDLSSAMSNDKMFKYAVIMSLVILEYTGDRVEKK